MTFTEKVDLLIDLLSYLPWNDVSLHLSFPRDRTQIDTAYKPHNASIGITLDEFKVELELVEGFVKPETLADPDDYNACIVPDATIYIYEDYDEGTIKCTQWECDSKFVDTYIIKNGEIQEPATSLDSNEAEIWGWVEEIKNN